MKNTNDRETDCNTKSDSQKLCAWISRRDADDGQPSVYRYMPPWHSVEQSADDDDFLQCSRKLLA